MSAPVAEVAKSLESELLRSLAGGLDTQTIDAFLDQLLTLAVKYGSIRFNLPSDRTLRLQSQDAVLHDADTPRAKTKLRVICARLAVRCGEWTGRPVSPYGDMVEFVFPLTKQHFKLDFENTTEAQEIAIETQLRNSTDLAKLP